MFVDERLNQFALMTNIRNNNKFLNQCVEHKSNSSKENEDGTLCDYTNENNMRYGGVLCVSSMKKWINLYQYITERLTMFAGMVGYSHWEWIGTLLSSCRHNSVSSGHSPVLNSTNAVFGWFYSYSFALVRWFDHIICSIWMFFSPFVFSPTSHKRRN